MKWPELNGIMSEQERPYLDPNDDDALRRTTNPEISSSVMQIDSLGLRWLAEVVSCQTLPKPAANWLDPCPTDGQTELPPPPPPPPPPHV